MFSYWNVTHNICLADRHFTWHNTINVILSTQTDSDSGGLIFVFSTASSRIRWSDSGWSRLKHLVSYEIPCAANEQGMQGGRILVYKPSYPFIFRREWDNVTCTSEKWKYERRIYSLCKILSANLGVKTWSRHILGCCHIYFIKPQTYSARLPPKANDSPHIWNDFMRVTKHFLQSIFRYYDLCMTHFFIILCGLNTYICLP